MSDPGLYVVVANPRAGGGRAALVAERIAALAKEAGRACEVALTQHAGHATRIAAEAAPRAAAVLALGGDGTIHEVVNGLAPAVAAAGGDPARVAALGTIPLGTGNDLVRTLGLPRDPIEAFLAIRAGRRRRIDLGRVSGSLEVPERTTVRALLAGSAGGDGASGGGSGDAGGTGGARGRAARAESASPSPRHLESEWFANDFSAGLGANTIVTMMNPPLLLRLLPARLAYMVAGMVNGFVPATRLSVVIDGVRSARERFHEVHVGNGRYCGGGAQFTPQAVLDDGLLDTAVFHTVGRLRNFWTMLTQVQGGTTRQSRGVDVGVARRVEISCERPLAIYLDGDLRIARAVDGTGITKVGIEVVKGALEVLGP